MNTDKDILNQVKHYAEEFVERKYPDEVPYFDIAWETYMRTLHDRKGSSLGRGPTAKELRGPVVKEVGGPRGQTQDNTIMAPKVIRAFHILLTETQSMEIENNANPKQEMLEFLLQKKFSVEFSMEIVNFFMEKRKSN